jgi:hypothetical protein
MVDGSRAELIVDASAIQDQYLIKLLQTDQSIDLIAPPASVLIAVKPARLPAELQRRVYDRDLRLRQLGGTYVEVVLDEPLRMRLSGAKRGAFSGGACLIPALDQRRAISLNQAFTFISEVFEPDRQSHVGNAFRSGLWFNDEAGGWSTLEALRVAYEEQFRAYLTEQCGVTNKKQRLAGPPSFNEWLTGKRQQCTLPF